MIDLVFANKPFGLRYDVEDRNWKIIFEVNLNTSADFSLGKQGDNSNQQLDSSWLVLFTTDTEYYTAQFRLLRYIFESDLQVRFFFDASDKIYDTRTNTVEKDKIKVLSINPVPDDTIPFTYDRDWEITEEYTGLDGYVDTKKIQISFSDTDDDSVVDNPDIFLEIVAPLTNPTSKYVAEIMNDDDEVEVEFELFEAPVFGSSGLAEDIDYVIFAKLKTGIPGGVPSKVDRNCGEITLFFTEAV
jgi:hypothetical protein